MAQTAGPQGGAAKPDERHPALTYASYLRLEELLRLQCPRSAEHDEILFIIIHQVYELWFKEVLHELARLRQGLLDGETPIVRATLKRVLTILKTLVAQVDVLETMTPVSFLSFRARLESASGLQSAQFREIEFVLGRKNRALVRLHPEGTEARRRLEERLHEPTVWDAFLRYLCEHRGYAVPRRALERDPSRPVEPEPELQPLLIEIYRTDPDTAQVCELLVDLDEGLQEWRYRHVKMVERTIGTKRGTGGSSGAAYLRATLFQPLFPDLWAIRSEL
ncbi:MAG: tryptophan 2,3-dioxygenase [Planctomycetota bacterium]|nr:MAG: tryptophan 2,3-dioxygenase [Planctomycetota bacterium]